MNVILKRHFLLSLLSIYAITILLMRIQGIELTREFLVSFPLISIAFFPPFRFTRERVSFVNNQLRLKEGEHLHSEIMFEDIEHIEGRSLLGVLPILSVIGKSNKQIVLSMKAEGVLELEDTLLTRIPEGASLHNFFRFHRILIGQTISVESAMVWWLRLSFLFGIAVPVLVWDSGVIAEQLMTLTLIWFAITAGSGFLILIYFAILNRILLLISADWAEKHLTTVRVWTLLFFFFGYLAAGHRFCWQFFS